MAAAVVLVLVTGDAVVEGHFAGEPAFGQQFQGAIDGGVADAGVFFLNQAVKLVGRKMIAGFEKRAQNRVALGGLLQTDALQMTVKDVLSFADHLAGYGGLIVDAVLQHRGTGVRIPPGILKMKFIFSGKAEAAEGSLQSEIRHE